MGTESDTFDRRRPDSPPARLRRDAVDTADSYGPGVSERLLEHSDVTLPIPGTGSIEHLEENVAASGVSLTDEEYARLS